MRRYGSIPALLLGLAGVVAGASQAAPQWTKRNGLDFWNMRREEESLQREMAQGRALEVQVAEMQRWSTACEDAAARVCNSRMTLSAGVDEVLAIGATAPEWFPWLRRTQGYRERLPANATDRDVATSYLLHKIDLMRQDAETSGDATRAAAISSRLSDLDEERRAARE